MRRAWMAAAGLGLIDEPHGGSLERRHPKRLESIERDDPRRNCGGEVLRQERSQRLVLPGLDVARGVAQVV